MSKKAIKELEETLRIMKKYEHHTSPKPEAGSLYYTFNGSVVFVYESAYHGAESVILKGGAAHMVPGDSYRLTDEGLHDNEDAGPHMVMGLREKINIDLPPSEE